VVGGICGDGCWILRNENAPQEQNRATIKPKQSLGRSFWGWNSFIRIFSPCFFAALLANAKMNVETFPPSFWVMSIRLIWSAKICDLSDSNSGWASPGHSSHRPPKICNLYSWWPNPDHGAYEYLMRHHTYAIRFITCSSVRSSTSSISHLTSSGILLHLVGT